jgi:hypothetical protein
MPPPNPFEVLRLDPTASEADIVRQAGRLRQRITEEATLGALRQAVQALMGRPEDRPLHALLTHPRPAWSVPALERFAAAFRRPPASAGNVPPVPEVDLEEFRTLLLAQVAQELDFEPLPFEPLPPHPDAGEIRKLMEEALWQSLLFDMWS